MAGSYRNIWYTSCKYLFSFLPDTLFHNVLGFVMHKRFRAKYTWMNIHNPQTFSEKLQYLKLHPISENLVELADKYDVRKYVEETIGEEYLIPLEGKGIYNNVEDINFDELPNEFVIKLTKGSGYNIICKNKKELDLHKTKNQLNNWLKINPYYMSREAHYKGKSRIIIEKMLDYNITDYKFFCFNGKIEFVELISDRAGELKKMFYDLNWNKLNFTTGTPIVNSEEIPKPENFDDLVKVANQLAQDFKFVRIDLYTHQNKVYFGELTFYPAGGYTPITPKEWDRKLGDLIKL